MIVCYVYCNDFHLNCNTSTEYVIQKYIMDPMLWKGFKFHFRMYAFLQANMRTFLYEEAFVLTAGKKYDRTSDDVQKQITNLSINKKLPGHPGQIPINVKNIYPKVRTMCTTSHFLFFFSSFYRRCDRRDFST